MAETPKELMERLRSGLNQNPDVGKDINAVYQFVLEGENGGAWWVDLTKIPPVIGEGSSDSAGCTITMDSSDFLAMMNKTANPMVLFMSKKLKVAGDLTLALKLQNLLNIL